MAPILAPEAALPSPDPDSGLLSPQGSAVQSLVFGVFASVVAVTAMVIGWLQLVHSRRSGRAKEPAAMPHWQSPRPPEHFFPAFLPGSWHLPSWSLLPAARC